MKSHSNRFLNAKSIGVQIRISGPQAEGNLREISDFVDYTFHQIDAHIHFIPPLVNTKTCHQRENTYHRPINE